MIKKVLLFTVLSIVLAGGGFFGHKHYAQVQKNSQLRFEYEEREAEWLGLQQRIKAEISSFKGEPGIVIKDLETGWEFSFDKDKLFPAASLTKVPLMAACFLAAEQGAIKLDQSISLKAADKLTGSGLLKDLPVGLTFSVERLVGLMIYDSDNTATNIVTNLLGLRSLNNTFKSFGLKKTDLARKIADYQARDKGIENYTTAEDMAFLLEEIYRRRLGSKNVSEQCLSTLKLTRMNDRIPKYFPPEISVAHKTGLENSVCHDAGIVFTRKGDFIIVVLTKHSNENSTLSKEFIAKVAFCVYEYASDLTANALAAM